MKKGFLAIGVTSEAEGPTKGFMEQTSAKMAVAYEPSLKSMKAYGFNGFPSSASISPKGVVVWTGHPSSLTEKIIEENLVGVVMNASGKLTVDADLPKKYASIAKQLEKGDLGEGMKALDAALAGDKVADADRAALEAAKEQVNAVLEEGEEGDRNRRRRRTLVRRDRGLEAPSRPDFKGHEAAKAGGNRRSRDVAKDPAKKKELEAEQRIAEAQKAAAAGKKKEALAILDGLGTGYLEGHEGSGPRESRGRRDQEGRLILRARTTPRCPARGRFLFSNAEGESARSAATRLAGCAACSPSSPS
jgi:hypothetical protein